MAASDLTLPTTLADHLGGGVSSGDARLGLLISAASAAIRGYLNQDQLHYQAGLVEKVASSLTSPRICLAVTPVVSVASVVLPDGTTITDWELEDVKLGFIRRLVGWPYTGQVLPGLLQVDPLAGSAKAGITVTYTAGWVTPAQASTTGWDSTTLPRNLPVDLELACILTATAMYRGLGRDPTISSEGLGDYSVSYLNPNKMTGARQSPLPDAAQALADNYMRPLG